MSEKENEKQIEKENEKQIEKENEKQIEKENEKQIEKQIEKQNEKQIEKEKNSIIKKEDLNANIKHIEEKVMKMISKKESNFNKEITHLKTKINSTVEKSNVTIENYSSQKLDHEKLLEFEVFKNKVDSMLITHELRINNNIQDLVKFQSKYDKIILDNLLVPGYIGPSCKFSNMGHYILGNIYEMSRMKSEKEQMKKDTKEVKTKIDTLMKQMIVLNDGSVQRCTEYVDTKQKDIENIINSNLFDFNDKIREIRASFSLFQNQIDEQINLFKSDIMKILNMREDINNFIDDKFVEMQKNINEVHKKVVLNIQDIGILKRKINDLNELNLYYKKNYSSKKSNILKKRENVYSFQDTFNANLIDIIKSRDDKNYFQKNNNNNNIANSLSTNTQNKQSDFVALNFDNFNENLSNNNIISINNNFDLNRLTKIKEKGNKIDIKKIDLDRKDKIINSEYSSKKKNMIQNNKSIELYKNQKKEKQTKIDSFDNLLTSKPFILDQKILSDADIKQQKEKNVAKKEIIKKTMHKNLVNLRIISGNNPLDLYNYSTSVPKIINFPKRNKIRLGTKRDNNLEENKNKQDTARSKTFNNIKVDKNLYSNNYKLVNLELEENASINPDTNNGAYVIAHKQTENNNVTKLNITPTSFVNIYNVSEKSSRILNMTFAKEEQQKMKNSFLKTTYNDNGNDNHKNKLIVKYVE